MRVSVCRRAGGRAFPEQRGRGRARRSRKPSPPFSLSLPLRCFLVRRQAGGWAGMRLAVGRSALLSCGAVCLIRECALFDSQKGKGRNFRPFGVSLL